MRFFVIIAIVVAYNFLYCVCTTLSHATRSHPHFQHLYRCTLKSSVGATRNFNIWYCVMLLLRDALIASTSLTASCDVQVRGDKNASR
jgi:hypothetical protein